MNIAGVQKVTLLDYPGKVACEIFTQGCNFECPFCQNSSLIPITNTGEFSEEEIFEYLNLRKNILDGVVITGGEPTVQKDLKGFIKKIKDLGLLVKLDTNGGNPKVLQELIDEKLVDYVAMDIKNIFNKYNITAGKKINLDNIKKSIEILKASKIDYEFRTTIIKEMHSLDDIISICKLVGNAKYYLQNFEDSENVIDHSLHGFSREELLFIDKYLKDLFPNVEIRALS
ncbi:MAG TPA: anaerobic ribonucleoside-triphosphate reductase activating protein [Candidatus Onthocola stercorigallinarum]|nr:anaerobic ribonucleoside-triphosphate reductase activating protein [Candidatus Onthocola stercorigallinarum]